EPVFDSVPLGKTEEKKNVLLVAAPEEIVMSYHNLLEEVNLKPIVCDIGPLALYRLCQFSGLAEEQDHVMILNFDQNLLTISIFHNDIPIFMRPVILEIDSFTDDAQYILEDAFN